MGEHSHITDHNTSRVSHSFAVPLKSPPKSPDPLRESGSFSSPAGVSHAHLPIWCEIDNLGKANEMEQIANAKL